MTQTIKSIEQLRKDLRGALEAREIAPEAIETIERKLAGSGHEPIGVRLDLGPDAAQALITAILPEIKVIYDSDGESPKIDGDVEEPAYIVSPEDGSVYTLRNGELCQHPLNADNSFEIEPSCAVDWERGVEDGPDLLRLKAIERMLRSMGPGENNLESIDFEVTIVRPKVNV